MASGLVLASAEPPSGGARRGRRGRGDRADEATLGEPAGVVAEHAGGEAVGGCDHTSMHGRVGELGAHDRLEHEVADGAASLPALVPILGDDALGAGGGVEAGQRLEPRDACEAMPGAAGVLGVEDVGAQGARRVLAEAVKPGLPPLPWTGWG